jgi:GAF domain-containing protein/HAMP domain-containing protein
MMSKEAISSPTWRSERSSTDAPNEDHRTAFIERVMLIGTLVGVGTLGIYVLLYLRTRLWQVLVDGVGVFFGLVCLIVAFLSLRRGKLDAAGPWLFGAAIISYTAHGLVWAGRTPYHAMGGVLAILLVGSFVLPRRWNTWLAAAGFYVALVIAINLTEPIPRLDAGSTMPGLTLFDAGTTILLVFAGLWIIARAFRTGTISTRLLLAFVALVLLPAALISVISSVTGFQNRQQQAIEQLELKAAFKENEINSWTDKLQSELATALTEEVNVRYTRDLLSASGQIAQHQRLRDALSLRWTRTVKQSEHLEALHLLNLQGQTIVTTDNSQVGSVQSDSAIFQEGLEGPYVKLLLPSTMDKLTVIAAQPVTDKAGQTLGVLVGYAPGDTLNEIVRDWMGLSDTGQMYLVSPERTILTNSRNATAGAQAETRGTEAALTTQANGAGMYDDFRGVPVVGAYRWLPRVQAALLVEQDQAEVFRAIYSTLIVIGGIALLAVLIAVIASLFITRSIAKPLASLSDTATQVAAGNLELQADVKREDEVGSLARAFNAMTVQLRELIENLEAQIAERTRDLERRSTYLEAASEVGRAAASILKTDRLVRQVVELIQYRFDLYYVGLFQLDEKGEWAVLRAGTGDAGRALLARGHRIKVGEGMIGWSIANAQPRIASEVDEDAVRQATSELPDTRSEAALPLRSRGQVLGALTVQSDQSGFFDEDTLTVLQTMADQVALALDNARLFADRQSAIEAQRRAYGQISHEAWVELLRTKGDIEFTRTKHGFSQITDQGQRHGTNAGKPYVDQEPDDRNDDGATIITPLKVRDRPIGVVQARRAPEAGRWTAEEMDLLETLVVHLGQALESARLYQETRRRATREQLARQITEKVRAIQDVETIARTAAEELTKALGGTRGFVKLGTKTLNGKGHNDTTDS